MIRSIVLLALCFRSTSGHLASNPSSHYSELLKIKCDALPYRTIYNGRNCYFVIDADLDVAASSKQCFSAFADAKVAQPDKVPDEVWSRLFVDKTSFISDAESKGKTKAMCILENRFNTSTSTAPRATILTARMIMPTSWKFPGALEVGQTIIITGAFACNESRASFNLQQDGFDKFETIALQLALDFNHGQVEFATRHNGMWQLQNTMKLPNPFKRRDQFDIRFRIHDDHVQVFVNREEFGNYKFRIPLSTVNTLGISGIGHVSYVQLGERYDPVAYSGKITIGKVSNTRSAEDEKSVLPVDEVFANGFPVCGKQKADSATNQFSSNASRSDCKSLIITGRFTPKVRAVGPSFWINLKRKNGDIALHFIARWNEKDVVLNSWTHPGGWQTTVRNRLPFQAGNPFKIAIVNDVLGFKISVNGVYFATFEHRMYNSDIAVVEVSPHVYDLVIQLQ